jgi:ParB family chromosome partitioning protein
MAHTIPVKKIIPNPNQPRTVFNEASLAELAESIRANGLIQPIVVEDNGDGTYTLVGGERRLRAHQLLGESSIQAEIRARSNHGGRELLIMGLVENIQREDMNPMDEAEAYLRLREDYGMTWAAISNQLGKNATWIQQRALLTKLDPEIKELIRDNKLTSSPDVARALLAIPSAEARVKLARSAADRQMTWKQIVAVAKKLEATFAAEPSSDLATLSLALARKGTGKYFSDITPPENWDALASAGVFPRWKSVTQASQKTCEACSLRSMANDATCRDCPAVELIKRMVQYE